MTTERESMVCDLLVVGAGPGGLAAAIRAKQLAALQSTDISVMGISPRTVESHRQNIKRKLQLASQTGLTIYALREVAANNTTGYVQGAPQGSTSMCHVVPRHAQDEGAKQISDDAGVVDPHQPDGAQVFGDRFDIASPKERFSNNSDHVHQ